MSLELEALPKLALRFLNEARLTAPFKDDRRRVKKFRSQFKDMLGSIIVMSCKPSPQSMSWEQGRMVLTDFTSSQLKQVLSHIYDEESNTRLSFESGLPE